MTYLKAHLNTLVVSLAIAGATVGYHYTRPTLEGEIISSNFSNKQISEINVRNNETGSIDKIILGTISGKDIKTLKLGFAQSYQGRAEELEQKLIPGQNIRIKVYNDEIKEAYRINGLRLANDNYDVQSQRSETKKQTGLFNFN